ncbi:hypothetical protein BDV18DRAFT_11722 [Aspergillus unguis]
MLSCALRHGCAACTVTFSLGIARQGTQQTCTSNTSLCSAIFLDGGIAHCCPPGLLGQSLKPNTMPRNANPSLHYHVYSILPESIPGLRT